MYDVERVLIHRYVTRGRSKPQLQFLVHWEGYGSEHDSWEPEVNLRDAPEPLTKYADYLRSVGQELKPPQKKRRKRPVSKQADAMSLAALSAVHGRRKRGRCAGKRPTLHGQPDSAETAEGSACLAGKRKVCELHGGREGPPC